MPSFHESSHGNHIEFDAPFSAGSDPANTEGDRPFSIDLSLELERQLTDMESPPTSPPAHDSTFAAQTQKKIHDALDPDVLAHIVVNLRQALAEMTKERDDLVRMLAAAHSQEASFKDALQLMTDKATEAEEELGEARKKMREDEEAISMLRAKVEESRRGLMRLQTESRRQSMAPVDTSRAPFISSPASKRASFTPLTGSGRPNGHKRISSVSDTNVLAFLTQDFSTSPNAQTLTFAESGNGPPPPPSSSRRFSGLFGKPSPPNADLLSPDNSAAELDILRKELLVVKDELETSKHELSEAQEAREASEECVKTLREFIAENNIGVMDASGSGALPSPAFVPTPKAADPKKGPPGWGFNLWKLDPAPRSGAQQILPSVPTPTTAIPVTATPLTQKLGGFFGSRTPSIASTTSGGSTLGSVKMPALQTNVHRNSMHSASDVSSMVEPISPEDDIHGLGKDALVQDVTNLMDMGVTTEMGKGVPVGSDGPRVVLG